MRFIRKTHYNQDIDLFAHNGQRIWYGLLGFAVLAAPLVLDRFYLGELAQVYIFAIAGIGLMLLVGYTGLVSLGHAAFLAIGAYAHAYFLNLGWPFPAALAGATVLSGLVGGLVGVPALRMTGIYLAVATLAFAVIIEQVLSHWVSVTGGFQGMPVPRAELLADLGAPVAFYFLCLLALVLSMVVALNILRSPTGRAMVAVRDSETSARSMGINLAYTKTLAFALSAAFTGLAGGLYSHKIGYLAPDGFTIITSIQLLLMVVVGGLGSLHGVIFGAIFIGLLPQGIAMLRDVMPPAIGQIPGLEPGVFGMILVAFLIYEPLGIYGRWIKIRLYFEEFPLYRRATYKRQKSYLKTERLR
ncbi:MAG: branched-chain amino acid ABC transporter permease [Pseudomonadales bacterium]|jgi:branched-chain amino acid transport system permease protein|nr:branched-chain amino acid ABC transporter permease [Pseudomonadales bacterium]MDP6471162.1 branched-chain amino acid ABC transporter permease [Pseudomonadales bacterium]MDP6825651.1 branched-chain amino acid ABC transporter permease [Pseudomonadales bacterium]MDP6971620.1 branched-chain amino acid ABC transporter permease [Pseudomonadales bacterium]|tara:strand:+ start:1219 stop:2292 length:1074 start_codon:yes stop_codon:yes gene_type:complete